MKICNRYLQKYVLFSCGCVFFFLCILAGVVIDNRFISVFIKYTGVIVGTVLGVVSLKGKMNSYIFVLLVAIVFGSIASFCWSANGSYNIYIYLLLSYFIGIFLWDRFVVSECLLVVLYINALFAVYNFSLFGVENTIYSNLSNNYISYHLLAPACIYYSLRDIRRESISILPAVVTWIVCILAQGRGGIFTATILFVGVLLVSLRKRQASSIIRKMVLGVVLLFLVWMIGYFAINYSSIIGEHRELFSHFAKRGMNSAARIEMWSKYLSAMAVDFRNFLFGVNLDELGDITVRLKYNLHNSFFFIHAFSGMISFLCVCIFMCKSFFYAYKKNYWLFILCFIVFLLRSATDRIFWGNDGNALLFFFLLMPYRERVMVKSLLCDNDSQKYRERRLFNRAG